jgi:hypothetical protein
VARDERASVAVLDPPPESRGAACDIEAVLVTEKIGGDRGEALRAAFDLILDSDMFEGMHVSLDRSMHDELYVQVVSDWIEAPALAYLLDMCRSLELSLTAVNEGIRIDLQTGETVRAVQAVKDTLAAERSADDD